MKTRISDHSIDQLRADGTSDVLRVVIPFTTPELSAAALHHTGVCTDLNVHVSLVDIQVVPFPCPLDQPPIDKEFSQQRLREVFEKADLPGKTEVLYTRDWLEGFRHTVESDSLVILAARKRWWPTREDKLARALTKAGHQVLLIKLG